MRYGTGREVGKNGGGELEHDQHYMPTRGQWAVWRTRPAQRSAHRISFDDLQRVNAMRKLNGNWGCRLLRVLLYRLQRYGD